MCMYVSGHGQLLNLYLAIPKALCKGRLFIFSCVPFTTTWSIRECLQFCWATYHLKKVKGIKAKTIGPVEKGKILTSFTLVTKELIFLRKEAYSTDCCA